MHTMLPATRGRPGRRHRATTLALGLALACAPGCGANEPEGPAEAGSPSPPAGQAAGSLSPSPLAGQAARALTVGAFKLMTYNIKNGFAPQPVMGDPSMADFAATIAAEDPDVVALQEVSKFASGDYAESACQDYDNVYYEDQVKSLSALTGLTYYAFSGSADREHSNYLDIWDETMSHRARGGVAFLSKHPFVGSPESIEFLRDEGNAVVYPLVDSNRGTALKVTVRLPVPGGTMLTDLYSVHLSSDDIRRAEEAHDIERAVHPTRPAFLLGDLNATKVELTTLPGWLDPRGASPEILSYPSSPTLPGPPRQIDWVLYRNVRTLTTAAYDVAGGTDSDHQAWVLEPAIGAQCAAFDPAAPDPNFCSYAACGKCGEGQGACANDAQCAPGLTCHAGAGAVWGLPAGYGVCEVPAAAHAVPARVESTYGSSGPANIYPTSQTYRIDATQGKTYSVKLRYATTATNRLARLFVDGRAVARALVLANTGAWNTFAEVTFKHVPLAAGDHVAKIEFDGDGVNVDWADFFFSNPGPFGQIPWPMPAFIQAEDYDVDGAFDATPGNDGDAYRFGDGVDVYTKESHQQAEGGYRVAFGPSEWVEYSVDAVEAATFQLALRYAHNAVSPVSANVSINGGPATNVSLPPTYVVNPAYGVAASPGLAFPAGVSTVRITSNYQSAFSLDSLAFLPTATGPLPGTPWPVPGRIEAENYDLGGGAHADTTAGNAGNVLRWDSVDLWFDQGVSNDHYVWSTAPGEFLQYTIDVPAAPGGGVANYDLKVRYATTHAGKTVKFLLDGVAITGNIALAPTCGWGGGGACWAFATAPNEPLAAGTHVLRLVMNTGLHNVDYLSIEASP